MGNTFYYLPREVQIENVILGEDIISKFGVAIQIEMYLADATGYQGDKEMFSKFGLELRNSYKLHVHKGRWETEVKTQFDGSSLNGESSVVIANYIRPREGDLIYDPITKFLMEITFVDHDSEFFSLGKNYKYVLSCEAFQYRQEEIATGIPEIDIFSLNSTDQLLNQVLMENGNNVIFEQEGYALQEDGNIPAPIREYGTEAVMVEEAAKMNVVISNPFE